MQGTNRGYKTPPKPGDGTLNTNIPVPETNWFGQTSEPQEEYIEDDFRVASSVGPDSVDPDNESEASAGRQMSEGRPTFSGHESRRGRPL